MGLTSCGWQGDRGLLTSWLPALRQLALLGVPMVSTCPNMVVDGVRPTHPLSC